MEPAKPVGNVAELFAGIGGFRIGLSRAGWKTTFSNQWEPSTKIQHASDVYKKNFGDTGHTNIDVTTVKALPKNIDLLVGGFPCFPAGTLILTIDGWKPIEEIKVGTMVLTHLGNWKPVTKTMNRITEETYTLSGHGVPNVITTKEHPFYARSKTNMSISRSKELPNGTNKQVVGEPEWVEASEMKGSFASQVLPPIEESPFNKDLWWLIGRYLADGWLTTGRNTTPDKRLVICCALEEADYLASQIEKVVHATRSKERTVAKFTITQKWFLDIVKPLGKYAHGKTLTSRELSLPPELAEALLAGYISGDGNPTFNGVQATTVSRALALSMALLAQRARGVVASVHYADLPPTCVIEGRTVNQRPQYKLVIPNKNNSAFVEGNYGWKIIKKVKHTIEKAKVYNIAIQDDESYVADGVIVHNCQDYSVAKTSGSSKGLEGKKGVLWWEILRLVKLQKPKFIFLENVDRLLKSPSKQRGRDFAIMLKTLSEEGYSIEWRVVNAAEYGFPQRRIRVFIVATKINKKSKNNIPENVIYKTGILARALPIKQGKEELFEINLKDDADEISANFNKEKEKSPFLNSGYVLNGVAYTVKTQAIKSKNPIVLGDILISDSEVPQEYWVKDARLEKWKYLKGTKSIQRIHKASGIEYTYSEGKMAFPDLLTNPSRTILTAEGGSTPSRFKHIIKTTKGYRRLTPLELERLSGFPDDWTKYYLNGKVVTDAKRAFFIGNALVVGLIERVGKVLAEEMTLGNK